MKKIKAIRMGMYGAQRRRPGDVFEVEDDFPAVSWYELVDDAAPCVEPSFRTRRGGEYGPAEDEVI